MQRQPNTIWNITANVGGTVVNMISGLLIMPYLIQRLGATTYGLWILIGTATGYFGILDLGVPAAVGRLVAIHRARAEPERINVVMSTACALLVLVSLAVCVATGAAVVFFPVLFTVPAASALDVHYSLILVGLNLALAFPASIYSGLLWGFERFDLQNAIDIPGTILRTVLTMTLVSRKNPLISLAIIVLIVGVLTIALKMAACYKLAPRLEVSLGHVDRKKVREIFSISGWMSVISWSRTLIPQIPPTLIGAQLGSGTVTTFTVARQLVAYANIFSISATQVMTPRATGAYATNSPETQRRLFLEGGRFACALAIFLTAGLICLGMPFIHWWQHGSQDAAYWLAVILMLGESLPMSQWLTYSVLLGEGRQRALALLAVTEGLITVPLILILGGKTGITGICLGVALSGFLVRGLIHWFYGCWTLRVPLWRYVRQVFFPVMLVAAPTVAALYAAVTILQPHSFGALLGFALSYGVLFAITIAGTLLPIDRLRAILTFRARQT